LSIRVQISKVTKAYNVLDSLFYAAVACRAALPITLLEVGARGGLQKRWTALHACGWLQPLFVEADPAYRARNVTARRLIEHEINAHYEVALRRYSKRLSANSPLFMDAT